MSIHNREQSIKVEMVDKVALVTLNKSENLNAITMDMHHELENLWTSLAQDESVNAVVLTGAGKAFSAGGDMRTMESWARDPLLRPPMSDGQQLIDSMLAFNKPVIAAVNGDAIGLGATLALLCDIVIAGENARIGDPHVRVGIVPGDGGCILWPLLVGVSRAKEYLMTGDLMGAREAERIGLINRVVPADSVLPTSLQLAGRLASGPTRAISGVKMCINKTIKQQANMVSELSMALEYLSMDSKDHKEAIAAFMEKRKPLFVGR